jgi:hypothetical protein
VVCQQVVPIEAGAADGRSMIETSMRTMPVVLMEAAWQFDSTFLGVVISTTVGPFPHSRLDEARCPRFAPVFWALTWERCTPDGRRV